MYRESIFNTAASATQKRKVPMVGAILAEAAHTLFKKLWDNYGRSPFHYSESSNKSEFSASIQELIKAMVSMSPSTKSQKAIMHVNLHKRFGLSAWPAWPACLTCLAPVMYIIFCPSILANIYNLQFHA